ncbi:beta-ketoacyl-ACP synthase III [Streptomyces antarcticus]|uniref:beta-ketoacyl-ACP synthase III n=1 Tax=Streptomyces antarcticus TaxID=2996458 RepID=UPI00226FA1E2|nr:MULTISPECIES: beta-ketoacyl-ACP synthase III [unclassified Streptomyces]MCY0940132.1 ketoacyl-ACP synthase III [Streptomyces sp. H34-AA3]MCZ4080780.1 ketoacyl-ACP synthase III [Streptomyces sp. H34-S5]
MAGIVPQAGRPGHAAVICGLGYWLPPKVVTNEDLHARLGTSAEWIYSRTGISSRHVVPPGMATSDLAVEAGARALTSAGGVEVQALILATTTPDRSCPATAPEVASRLGMTGIAAFDVSAVCTGFLYGLATAAGFIAAGLAERVLLIAADTFSTLLDPTDRTTVPIFGDGAGALVLRRGTDDEPGAIGKMVLGSDGELSDLIAVEAAGSQQRSTAGREGYFRMQGREVFRHAVERMSIAATGAVEAAGWRLDEIDRLVAHQANARITSFVASELGIPPDRQVQNIEHVGNTAAASVPVLLAEATTRGHLAPGHRVLLTAFGGGLTWGATTVVWPKLECVPLGSEL